MLAAGKMQLWPQNLTILRKMDSMTKQSTNDIMSNGWSSYNNEEKRLSIRRMQRASSTKSWTGSTTSATGSLPAAAKTKRK